MVENASKASWLQKDLWHTASLCSQGSPVSRPLAMTSILFLRNRSYEVQCAMPYIHESKDLFTNTTDRVS